MREEITIIRENSGCIEVLEIVDTIQISNMICYVAGPMLERRGKQIPHVTLRDSVDPEVPKMHTNRSNSRFQWPSKSTPCLDPSSSSRRRMATEAVGFLHGDPETEGKDRNEKRILHVINLDLNARTITANFPPNFQRG
jgi:hypothetical protein